MLGKSLLFTTALCCIQLLNQCTTTSVIVPNKTSELRAIITESSAPQHMQHQQQQIQQHGQQTQQIQQQGKHIQQETQPIPPKQQPNQQNGPKILLYPFAHCPNSHLLNMEKLLLLLIEDGYQITMLVPDTYVLPNDDPRYAQVSLRQFRAPDGVRSICGFESMDDFLRTPLTETLKTFYKGTYAYCSTLLDQRTLLDEIKREGFELAIYDAVDQCSKLLSDYIDITFIVFHTSGMESILPRNPAFLPSMITSFTDNMSLWERTLNTLGYAMQNLIVHYTYNYYQQLRVEKSINASLSVYDSFDRAALRFVIGEWGLDYVGPTQPSHIMLGGPIYEEPKPLPVDLQSFLDNSPAGVVVLSFGSIAREFGPTWRELFADALSRLPYKVIWRYDESKIPVRLGNNTLLLPWLPQAQLLEHPNVLAFVSHCGMNAAYETARAGVPVVAIPLFADQFFQASKLVNHIGMGERLDIRSLTSDTLYAAILKVAQSTRFHQNAQRISTVMRDRPFSQHEQVTSWIRYVIKHGGASHLHCKGTDLEWYQYYLVDVIAVLISIFSIIVSTIYVLGKMCFNVLKGRYTRILESQKLGEKLPPAEDKTETKMATYQQSLSIKKDHKDNTT